MGAASSTRAPSSSMFDGYPTTIGVFALLVGAGVACSPPGDRIVRLDYDSTVVRDGDGETVTRSEAPGGLFVVYQEPPGFPVTVETTVGAESRAPGPVDATTDATTDATPDATESTADADGASPRWEPVELEQAVVRIRGNSECTRERQTCSGSACTATLRLPHDGYCVVTLSATPSSGPELSDCWGYAWVEGRGLSAEARDEKHRDLVETRDEICEKYGHPPD